MSDDETERSIPDENAEPYYHDGSDSSSISDHQTRRAILIVSDDNEDDEDDETPPKRSTFDDTPPPPPFSVDYSTSKKKEEEEKEDEWSPPLSADESPPLYNGMSPFSIASQRITQLQQRARAGSTESENSGASGRVRGIVSALQSRTGTPGSGWGWGSGVEPTSDDEERVRVRDEAAQDDGWGSVESASDAGEDDSWGSVEPASDADEEAVGEGQTEYEGESEDTGVGSEEEEEEDEDVVPLGFNEDGDYDEDEGVVPLGFDEDGDEKMDAWEDSPPLPERRIMRKRVVAKLLDSPQAAEKSAFIRAAHEKYEEEDRLLNTKAAFRLNHVPGRRRSTQKNSFTKKYVELLNDDILDAIGRDGYVDTNRTEESFEIVCGSAVLGSHWSRSEKEVFFNNLTVLGKDRVDEVAKAVGTKSVIECRAYILELEAAVKPIYKGMKKVGMDKIPAAVEVSCLCAEALERQAYHVERRKRIDEERMEKERWGVSWLIDTDLAEHIDMLIKDGDVDAIEDIAPDAELLNVKNMLQLSER